MRRILERDSVRLLLDTGVSNRVLREGYEHQGIEVAFGGAGHRIDDADLTGASVWLYPQTDVFVDLADRPRWCRSGDPLQLRGRS